MTTVHQKTQQEKDYRQFLDEYWEVLSEQARTLIGWAETTADAVHLTRNYSFQWPEEYDEAMNRMRLAAAILTERDQELLAKLWRAALAAAASIDADDFETFVGHQVHRGDLHEYYRMISDMVEKIGVVVSAIPEAGFGVVSISVGGHITRLNARSSVAVPAGTQVSVTSLISPTAVQVEPLFLP